MVDFVFNSSLELSKKSGRDYCEPDSDVNQFRLGSSTLEHVGSRGVAPMGGCVKFLTPIFFFFKFLKSPESITDWKIQNRSYVIN